RLLDSAERLAMLAEDGIVDFENGFVRVRREHRFVIRAVAAAFDAFLDRVAPVGAAITAVVTAFSNKVRKKVAKFRTIVAWQRGGRSLPPGLV
ncbi:hypothetical protein NKH81_34285, partial [Mesorhizobium sp. M0959]